MMAASVMNEPSASIDTPARPNEFDVALTWTSPADTAGTSVIQLKGLNDKGEPMAEGSVPEDVLERLREGLVLDERPLRPAKVSWQNEDQLRFVLREGRKRQIRRMCELVGLKVVGLKRVRIGSVVLGALPPGQWRYLGEDEQF